jgi:hypothetical protein
MSSIADWFGTIGLWSVAGTLVLIGTLHTLLLLSRLLRLFVFRLAENLHELNVEFREWGRVVRMLVDTTSPRSVRHLLTEVNKQQAPQDPKVDRDGEA